jgi:hypothetical protein
MGKARELTLTDFERAKELVEKFEGADINSMPYADQLELVRIYYGRIRGVPIQNLPEKQLYRIAERLYHQAHDIVGQMSAGNLERRVS